MAEGIEETLAQRGSAYGDFREQGRITQNLKRAMQDSPNWARLPSYLKEGLDMIQHKISRMLNGDALYDDNMHDIIGYTKLMQDRAAQDRSRGIVFETGGDKMYPVYEHEERDPFTFPAFTIGLEKLPIPNNGVDVGESINRANDALGFCMGKGEKRVTLDILDVENILYMASLSHQVRLNREEVGGQS